MSSTQQPGDRQPYSAKIQRAKALDVVTHIAYKSEHLETDRSNHSDETNHFSLSERQKLLEVASRKYSFVDKSGGDLMHIGSWMKIIPEDNSHSDRCAD
jgi:hypothetical protein